MTKKKKSPKKPGKKHKINIWLPLHIKDFYQDVSDKAGTTLKQTIMVVTWMAILRGDFNK